MLKLETEHLKLRAPEPSDLDILYEWENDPSIWHISNTPSPFSKNTLQQYLDSVQDIYSNKQLRLMIVNQNSKCIGCVDLFDFEPLNSKVGIGILVDRNHRNSGIAQAALKLMLPFIFNHLNLNQVYCTITASNIKSIALFEKTGFKKCGILKEWVSTFDGFEDAFIYQLISKDYLN